MGADIQAVSDAVMKIIALVFVNLVPLLLNPSFLAVAISIDSLVLGISVQSLLNKNTEKRLDLTLSEILGLARVILGAVEGKKPQPQNVQPTQIVRR